MRLLFVGDISLGEYYLTFGHGPRTVLADTDIFHGLGAVFKGADIIAGNLEASLTDNNFDENDPERYVLRGEPKQAAYLKSKGFNVLQVANNHSVQHGSKGFEDTVRVLRDSGIDPIGLKDQPLQVVNIGDKSIGFLAASDVPDNTDKSQTAYQRLDDSFVQRVKDSVAEVDHLFVMLHWGLEESTEPLNYQRELISEFAQAGVTGVIGSHPHLFYEIWKEGQTVAAPSLGNFVFDLCWDPRLLKTGVLDIDLDEEDGMQVRVWPVEITKDGAIPVISGPAVDAGQSIKLYDLGASMDHQLVRKLSYFFRNLMKGRAALKLKFFAGKIRRNLSLSQVFRPGRKLPPI